MNVDNCPRLAAWLKANPDRVVQITTNLHGPIFTVEAIEPQNGGRTALIKRANAQLLSEALGDLEKKIDK
jgi:hypothetical protein